MYNDFREMHHHLFRERILIYASRGDVPSYNLFLKNNINGCENYNKIW